MLKAYISGKITGDDQYLQKFTQAELYLNKQGFTVINPASALILFPKDTKYIEYMCNSLRLLDTCDCIYMLRIGVIAMAPLSSMNMPWQRRKALFTS